METTSFESSKVKNQEDIYYYMASEKEILDINKSKPLQDVFTKRPYTFCISSTNIKVSTEELVDTFDRFNYDFKVENNILAGIRSDLFALGFSFDHLHSVISSPEKKDVAQELICKTLESSQTTTVYSRLDEIELLSELF